MSGKLALEVPEALAPMLRPARYKGLHGGRGGAKSHFYAEQVVARCYQARQRIVCIREVQDSIRDSVRQLVVDKIHKFELEHWFDITEKEIRAPNGSLVTFRGMQSYNAENIKSLEGYDVAWVEEAQTLSKKSLQLLRPTLRKEGSELWFSWNPRFRTDAVDEFLRRTPPEDAIVLPIHWRDNPWFPEVLNKERLHDLATNPDEYEHIWEGGYGVTKGSILGKWVVKAENEGRINDRVVYDPDGPSIEISSDIGFRDTATWWFWQRRPLGKYALIHYMGDSGMDAEEWIGEIQKVLAEKGWKLGRIHLPHDAKVKTFQSRHSAMEQFLATFGPPKVSVVPKSSKADRINAARTIIDSCEFAESACADGLDGLRAWEFAFDDDKGVFSREPEHNWASHPSDGYSYGCQVMIEQVVPEEETKKPKWPHEQTANEVFWPKEQPVEKSWV